MERGEKYASIAVSSPDGKIWADTTDGSDLRLSFGYGTFERYTDQGLAHQLSRLGQLMWVEFQRSQQELHEHRLAGFAIRPRHDGVDHRSADQIAYAEALNEVVGEGRSADGTILVRTVGALSWEVDLPEGTVARLGERGLTAQVTGATRAMLADRERKIAGLKAEFLDLGVPRAWNQLLRELREKNRAVRR